LYVNETYAKFFGKTREEIEGKYLIDILSEEEYKMSNLLTTKILNARSTRARCWGNRK